MIDHTSVAEDVLANRREADPTLPLLAEFALELAQALRREWWLNHGHPFNALYGDDGEMQCTACPHDFKREPLDVLQHDVMVHRAA